MKRVTPKVIEATTELFAIQRNIQRAAKRLEALRVQEQEALVRVSPIFGDIKASAKFNVHAAQGDLVVSFTYVDRQILDTEKATNLLETLGRKVPKKHTIYSFIRVAKATEKAAKREV